MKRKLICRVNGWDGRGAFPEKVYREHGDGYTRLVCAIKMIGEKKRIEAITTWEFDPSNARYK